MQRTQYTADFKQQVLSKARQRGTRTLNEVAAELNMSLGTLRNWLKMHSNNAPQTVMPSSLPPSLPARQWSAAQRLLALQESHGLSGEALHVVGVNYLGRLETGMISS